jgi:hypothetical protein
MDITFQKANMATALKQSDHLRIHFEVFIQNHFIDMGVKRIVSTRQVTAYGPKLL